MDADASLSSFYLEFLCFALNFAPKNQINVFVPSVGRNLRAATSSSVISSFKTIVNDRSRENQKPAETLSRGRLQSL